MSGMRKMAGAGLAVACLVGAMGLGGCSSSDKPAEEGKVALVKEGTLTVCTNPPYAPFEDTQAGEIVGFDLDLMNEVAKDLKVTMTAVATPFEAIESAAALEVGDCDAGASGLTITDARKAKAEFSESYYDSEIGLLVPKDSTIKGADTLEGKMVGVQQGTTGEKWAKETLKPDFIRQYEHLGDQMTALAAGDVDGVINDVPTLNSYVTDALTLIPGLQAGEKFGFMIKKGNTALLSQVNATLARIRSDGTYDSLVAKWFKNGAAAE